MLSSNALWLFHNCRFSSLVVISTISHCPIWLGTTLHYRIFITISHNCKFSSMKVAEMTFLQCRSNRGRVFVVLFRSSEIASPLHSRPRESRSRCFLVSMENLIRSMPSLWNWSLIVINHLDILWCNNSLLWNIIFLQLDNYRLSFDIFSYKSDFFVMRMKWIET